MIYQVGKSGLHRAGCSSDKLEEFSIMLDYGKCQDFPGKPHLEQGQAVLLFPCPGFKDGWAALDKCSPLRIFRSTESGLPPVKELLCCLI